MGGCPVLPTWDTFVLVIPFLGILGMAMFGLDERFASPKTRPAARRSFCEVGEHGRSFLCDPDGKPWQKCSPRQIEVILTSNGELSGDGD